METYLIQYLEIPTVVIISWLAYRLHGVEKDVRAVKDILFGVSVHNVSVEKPAPTAQEVSEMLENPESEKE